MEEYFDVLNEYGEFTGKVESRTLCHKNGLWHRAVFGFVVNSNGEVLLQKRSSTKKLWPNKWDVTAGGHVLTGEIGTQAIVRETKEELGIDIEEKDVKYMFGSSSVNLMGEIQNKHYNECYLIKKDVDISKLNLQKEEVEEVKFFKQDEILNLINKKSEILTDKVGVWNFLKVILEGKMYK